MFYLTISEKYVMILIVKIKTDLYKGGKMNTILWSWIGIGLFLMFAVTTFNWIEHGKISRKIFIRLCIITLLWPIIWLLIPVIIKKARQEKNLRREIAERLNQGRIGVGVCFFEKRGDKIWYLTAGSASELNSIDELLSIPWLKKEVKCLLKEEKMRGKEEK